MATVAICFEQLCGVRKGGATAQLLRMQGLIVTIWQLTYVMMRMVA